MKPIGRRAVVRKLFENMTFQMALFRDYEELLVSNTYFQLRYVTLKAIFGNSVG